MEAEQSSILAESSPFSPVGCLESELEWRSLEDMMKSRAGFSIIAYVAQVDMNVGGADVQ